MNTDGGEPPVFDRAQCLALMRSVPIGRVVYIDRALPAITPVNFVLDGDAVIIRTGSDFALAAALRETVVAFEVDDIDPETLNGWWVTATGRARLLGASVDAAQTARLPLRPWVRMPNAQFIRIQCRYVAGGRFDLSAHVGPVGETATQTGT